VALVFDSMHLRLVNALGDVNYPTGASIVAATEDGKKRSSLMRSRDLMDGRYFLMSILRIVDKQIFYGIRSGIAFDAQGYLDITQFNIINHADIFLTETTTAYNKTVPVKGGNKLPIQLSFLRTFKTGELVAAVVSDNANATRLTRIRLYKGINVSTAFVDFRFDVGYFALPILTELVAGGAADVTEPRIWWPIIEAYALYLSWLGSGNNKRAMNQYVLVERLATMIVQNEYGTEASQKVSQLMNANDTVNG